MNEPIYQSPIPSPDGQMASSKPFDAAEIYASPWNEAPSVIRRGAMAATWLYLLPALFFMILGLISAESSLAGCAIFLLIGAGIVALTILLRRALKAHSQAAWKIQLVLSIIGLLFFPLGTLIGGLILSEWFRPETKAWFGIK